jgi:hypothetical protein
VDTSLTYQVSIPNKEGSFQLSLPKEVWEKKPDFFQTNMSYFSLKSLKPGDWISSSILPATQPHEPNIVPFTIK